MRGDNSGSESLAGETAPQATWRNPSLKLLALVFLAVSGLTLVVLTRSPQEAAKPDTPLRRASPVSAGVTGRRADLSCTDATTIRNVTDRTITYTICPAGRPEDLQIRQIAPSAIDCFPGVTAFEIQFREEDKDFSYSLDPGRPYAFRYDEGTRIGLFLGSHGRSDVADLAPFVPTPNEIVDRMLEMAGVTETDVIYDIGCGDGRIVIAAAKEYGARGVGIDLDQSRIDECLASAKNAGVERLVKFICMDATRADVSEATVVTLYLLSESNALLRPMFEKQLRTGSRVVSHNYPIAGWEQKRTAAASVRDKEGKYHTILVYTR